MLTFVYYQSNSFFFIMMTKNTLAIRTKFFIFALQSKLLAMRNNGSLKDSIKKSIDKLPMNKLAELRKFLDSIEDKQLGDKILSFAGSWSDLDEIVIDEFTKDLEKRRESGRGRVKI